MRGKEIEKVKVIDREREEGRRREGESKLEGEIESERRLEGEREKERELKVCQCIHLGGKGAAHPIAVITLHIGSTTIKRFPLVVLLLQVS